MRTRNIIIVAILFAFTSSNLFGQLFREKTEVEKLISIYNKQIAQYENKKIRLERKNGLQSDINFNDSCAKLWAAKKDNLIANLKPEDLKKQKVEATQKSSQKPMSLAKRQKQEIGGTGCVAENRMYNTLNVQRQVVLDNYRAAVLQQNASCGTTMAKNGLLFYTTASSYYSAYTRRPSATFVITAVDANDKKLVGIPVNTAEVDLSQEAIPYKLLPGLYIAEVYVSGKKMGEKKFEVITGLKSANYKGVDYEFTIGCEITQF